MAMETNVHVAGASARMMQVDLLLASQHFGPRRKQAPEQRLMIAVLQDAVDCLEKYRSAADSCARRLFHDANQWFLAEESKWPYSFESICGVLDLDPTAVRQSLGVTPEPQLIPVARAPGRPRK
jgi:hypothetical protein